MSDRFRSRLEVQLANYREWSRGRMLADCRVVHYCGVDLIGALDLPLAQVESKIEDLEREAFYVDWAEHHGRLFLRVWEFGGPEPKWSKVFAEQPLADIDELMRRIDATP